MNSMMEFPDPSLASKSISVISHSGHDTLMMLTGQEWSVSERWPESPEPELRKSIAFDLLSVVDDVGVLGSWMKLRSVAVGRLLCQRMPSAVMKRCSKSARQTPKLFKYLVPTHFFTAVG